VYTKLKNKHLMDLIIQHNNPINWYSKVCSKCKKKYTINRVTKPEIDDELNYCFDCICKYVYEI
jgi:hypothetical protein